VLGTVPSALAAFLISDFANYVLHRALHRSERLWRWSHQLHHSAERVDAAGFSFSHPVDSVLVSLVGGVIVAALGVTPSAGALTGLLGYLCTVFQHLNVRTPRFIGYLVQRPESHSVHHARGVHAYNYGNVPLWDILFGTFRNPASFAEKTGFWDGASTKISAMLLGRDVSEPEPGR
jgi:sterol desaturase/sphingolipid hydroxylase (fatty acid hydroxylase superfamily)